jgi:CRISPR-associated protein Cas6
LNASYSSDPVLPTVDCDFVVHAVGNRASLPADHGYALFSAVSRILPWIHGHPDVGIHPLVGRLGGQRTILLDQRSRLSFRVPAGLIPGLIPLAGQVLEVDGQGLQVGTLSIRTLKPTTGLYSRLVVIKGMLEPDTFFQAAHAQLAALNIQGQLRLLRRQFTRPADLSGSGGQGEWVRRTLKIKDKTIVGYSVEVLQLSPEDSLRLQSTGIGGRRRFGCGIFLPARIGG